MKFYFNFFLVFLFIVLLPSCTEYEQDPHDFGKGVFIVNEGAFGQNSGSISWYNPTNGTLQNNIFEEANGRPTGDVIQSFGIAGDLGFIVANNSQKVEIVNLNSFVSKGVVTGLTYPRHFAANKTHAFISNGSTDGTVHVIDLNSLEVIEIITVGKGPEQIAIVENKLYVANSGGWGFNNTVSVIDIFTRKVIATITVGDVPFALQKDIQNNLWVLCRGKVVYDFNTWQIIEETNSRLIKINTLNNTVVSDFTVGTTGDFFWPAFLSASGNKSSMYLNENGGIYSVNVFTGEISANPVITGNFSGLGIHPVTNEFFCLKTPNYTSSGTLEIYNQNKQKTNEYLVGIGPKMVIFGN